VEYWSNGVWHREKLKNKEVRRKESEGMHCGLENWSNGAMEYWSNRV
jgi:hypothetical protein